MKKAINLIKKLNFDTLKQQEVRVFGWQKEYDHNLVGSVNKYLFEEFETIENIAPLTNDNRPGNILEKYYVTVHDTGDSSSLHTAKFWSDTVKVQDWEQGRYQASFQYVVGNDGIYHNIPDDEVAYHAGDGTQFQYELIDAGVYGDNPKPEIDITEDGYYSIDGKKSTVVAPRAYKERNGVVLIDRIAVKEDINDQGILCKLIEGKYYLGRTYYNSGFARIGNRGGNNNSVGIESCIDEGTDLYYTWQKTAKLVAYLLDKFNLGYDDVKQHHYFSGKNCPQTIRMSGNWDHFMELVAAEYEVLQLKKEGYSFKLVSEDTRVSEKGRVILSDSKENIKYSVVISKDGFEEKIDLEVVI